MGKKGSCLIMIFMLAIFIATSPASGRAQASPPKLHLRLEVGYSLSEWVGGNFNKLLASWGFFTSVTEPGEGSYRYWGRASPNTTQGYRSLSFKVDYSLSPRWALRLTVNPPSQWAIEGYKPVVYTVKAMNNGAYYDYKYVYLLTLRSRFRGGSYYLGLVYPSKPERELNPLLAGAFFTWGFGAGLGLETIRMSYDLSESFSWAQYGLSDAAAISKSSVGSYVSVDFDYYFARWLSLGGHVAYRYILPVKFEPFSLAYVYERDDWDPVHKWTSGTANGIVDFPNHNLSVGGLRFGLDLGFHFW